MLSRTVCRNTFSAARRAVNRRCSAHSDSTYIVPHPSGCIAEWTQSCGQGSGQRKVEQLTGSRTHLVAARTFIWLWRGSCRQGQHRNTVGDTSNAPMDVKVVSASGESRCIAQLVQWRVVGGGQVKAAKCVH